MSLFCKVTVFKSMIVVFDWQCYAFFDGYRSKLLEAWEWREDGGVSVAASFQNGHEVGSPFVEKICCRQQTAHGYV